MRPSLNLIKTCRLVVKYLRECFLLPYRVLKIYEEIGVVRLHQNRIAGFLAASSSLRGELRSAIMTVVILRENAKFLDEWISHHVALGVDRVVLYDNSQSRYDDTFGRPSPEVLFDGITTNKHNVNYSEALGPWSEKSAVDAEMRRLAEKYGEKLVVIEWARTNEDGVVAYFQKEALKDFVLRFRGAVDYCFAMDTDEFLISDRGWCVTDVLKEMEERGVSSGILGQRRFLYRFASLDSQVREIPWCLREDCGGIDYSAGKTVFRLDLFTGFFEPFNIHSVPSLAGTGKIRWQDMRFHHYGWPSFRNRHSLTELDPAEQSFLQKRFSRDETMYKYL